jgi:undecaprenyl-diphosphatase
VLLGLIQGPTELLPVSSSGHLALAARALGRDGLPPELRKAFDVALHVGSAPALVAASGADRGRDLHLLSLTVAPPALAGLAFEGLIEARLGTTVSVAWAQALAGALLLAADARPARRGGANACDHLAVGLAQVAALAPGVSRSGAALTAARLRGLSRPAALSLSLRAALPVTVAAAALKGARLVAAPPPAELRAPMAVGAAAALLSALAALPLLRSLERRGALRVLAGYRIALGVAVLLRGGPLAGSPNRA